MRCREYAEIIKHHIRMMDKWCDYGAGVYQDEPYMMPSDIVDVYGDTPPE